MEKQRRQSHVCFRRGGTPAEALQRLRDGQQFPNLQAKYDYAGVCLRTMTQAVAPDFFGSLPWYEKGALGIPYHRIPTWYKDAVGIFEVARAEAYEAKAAEPKPKPRH